MKKKKVINTDNIALKPPIFATAGWVTILDYWNAPQWLVGIFGLIVFIAWAGYFLSLTIEEAVDIFDEKFHNKQ